MDEKMKKPTSKKRPAKTTNPAGKKGTGSEASKKARSSMVKKGNTVSQTAKKTVAKKAGKTTAKPSAKPVKKPAEKKAAVSALPGMNEKTKKKMILYAAEVVAGIGICLGLFQTHKSFCREMDKEQIIYTEDMIETEPPQTEPPVETETETETETDPPFEEKDILIGCTGSMLYHKAVMYSGMQGDGSYDFSYIYQFVKPYYQMPDFMTCEYEGSFGGAERGYSGYPNFNTPEVAITNMADAGIDLQLLASNHVYDMGHDSMMTTMQNYENAGVAYTGIRPDTDHKPYYMADINGISVAFINYVYEGDYLPNGKPETNTIRGLNGYNLMEEDFPLVNTFDVDYLDEFYEELSQRIQDMKANGAQFIVANMHWGSEYQLHENETQRNMAQRMADLGVDAIVGGHPHCEEPVDVLTRADGSGQVPVVYSVGNTLSNQRAAYMQSLPGGYTEDGVIVYLRLHQNRDGSVVLNGVDYIPTWCYLSGAGNFYILPLADISGMVAETGFDVAWSAEQSYNRTVEVMGEGFSKAKEIFGGIF